MTNWIPDLSTGAGPLYQRLADRIESDIDTGVLASGAKLPPQRDLAFDIGTTVGTVGRAYSLLRERGLVSGEVGRGTYILGRSAAAEAQPKPDPHRDGTRFLDAPAGKLRFDSTAAPDVGQSPVIEAVLAGVVREHPYEVARYTRQFEAHWLEAGSRWLSRNSFQPSPETIVPTLGVHSAIMAVISAFTNAGDYVVFEHLTYAHVARGVALIGRRIALVNSDQSGIDPDDFEALCAQKHPKMAFLMPTAHIPTAVTMPGGRRAEIARIARKYNVLLVEDDLYGHLTDHKTPLVAEYAPELTFVAGGLSKSVAAGMRGGWITCPPAYRHGLRVASKMLSGSLPFLLAEASARLVMSGQAFELRQRSIDEFNARQDLADAALAGFDYNSCRNTPFVWLAVPEPWNSGTFKAAALQNGVILDDEDEFKAGRSEKVFHRVRIGLGPSHPREEVARGLRVIRRLLEEGHTGYEKFD